VLVRLAAVFVTFVACAVAAPAAFASELIDRNASDIRLAVNGKGQAMVTYRARGRVWHVLAWGAVDARPSARGVPQVKFKLDYAGGWGAYRKHVWKTFGTECAPYDGPALQWFVTGCRAPDGSYWALQKWQRMLPNFGLRPSAKQAVWELRLSHWTTELAFLEVNLNWAYRRYDHMFGRFTYRGQGVFGFRSTPAGVPLDTYGRNLYVDTFNSKYGRGWKRENSFLMHTGSGAFCYGFYPHGKRPVGAGEKYRATIIGPGVTPDIFWQSDAPGAYERSLDQEKNELIRNLGSRQCKPN
jgi:hypothetical protein